jgi:hypothetical protein
MYLSQTGTNVATKRRSVSPFPQGREGILNKNYEDRWTGRSGPADRPDFNPQISFIGILGKWLTWRTILYHVFIFIINSLHVSSTLCSSSGETNCVNTTSGNCHSVSVTMSCAGRKWIYRRLYWHNLSLLMMILLTVHQNMMHGQQNVKFFPWGFMGR